MVVEKEMEEKKSFTEDNSKSSINELNNNSIKK